MADRPVLFSAPMVRALLEGRKTQTRRIIKPQPVQNEAGLWVHPPEWTERAVKKWGGACQTDEEGLKLHLTMKGLPYAPGDRLWVKEAWTDHGFADGEAVYRATAFEDTGYTLEEIAELRWRPSIYMPRWASRLTLTVTDVRVQRLQEISEADARAEGAPVWWRSLPEEKRAPTTTATGMFRDLWNSLRGPDAWAANSWVCALTFTVQRDNIDQLGGGTP